MAGIENLIDTIKAMDGLDATKINVRGLALIEALDLLERCWLAMTGKVSPTRHEQLWADLLEVLDARAKETK